jgi:hypothetical protein
VKSLKEIWFEFEFKRMFEKSLKKKRKKRKAYPPYLSAQRPNSRHPFPRSGPSPAVPFLFFLEPLTRRPRLSASPLPFPFFFLSSAQPDLAPPQSSPHPVAPSTFPFSLGKPIKAINPPP